MKNKKTLTKDAVRDVARELLEANDKTTTLEIKEELRDLGYEAVQADVSAFMDEIHPEEGWSFSTNGVYREYAEDSVSASSGNLGYSTSGGSMRPIQHPPTPTKSTTPKIGAYGNPHSTSTYHQMRDGRKIETVSAATADDWKVTSTDKPTVLYFGALYTRDEVRNAYSCMNKVAIQSTRTIRA